ncbi:isocitrate lyase/PEP mutase family protein [Mucilaginibacter aquariorum]|uniref:Isocitrate lyase/phosphoenolpyruvate mutase family protein n=1 Tax=Mucilaginibacter aquariorum TaxID=2967225 RepID=A0ABT1T8A5_9SPHI|nr:isocitrate lyase/phosphoenolpyruvate mutase family protein [Mucilaginibacter aquariorum]MCQ6960849.1 isocitrate lyase/phosphoenolpyruvate mutase family protein [Mucilaginibacter aquariorum]
MNTSPNNQQAAKAQTFKALHERTGLFVIPNPWDAGSAKMLAALGFEALATTSAGLAYALGRPDGSVSRDEALENSRAIVEATSLPVAADLENGYGDDSEACAETILLAAKAGLAGGSIEDATGNAEDPIYSFEHSVARIKAAVKAARSLPDPFMLTARAENFLHGRTDLKDTIRRLEAYADAGADVLYAPGLTTLEEVDAVVRAVSPKPVNVLLSVNSPDFTLDALAKLGVRRVSVGSLLARVAYGSFFTAAQELQQKGTFNFVENAIGYVDINKMFK